MVTDTPTIVLAFSWLPLAQSLQELTKVVISDCRIGLDDGTTIELVLNCGITRTFQGWKI